MSEDFSENIKKQSYWIRILFMVGFMVAIYVTGVILLVLIIAQALFTLFTGKDNPNLRRLGANLTQYVHEILEFLTYNSEERPFPISAFPLVDEAEDTGTARKTAPQTSSPSNEATSAEGMTSTKKATSANKATSAKKSPSTSKKASASGSSAKKKSSAKRSTAKKSPGSDTDSQ